MGWLTDPQVWASLVTLTALEIVLGIDNLLFIAIVAGRLPPERQSGARQVGLALALITRLALLASIVWIIGLTRPVFELFGQPVSWRDIVLIAGGLFLLYKGTREIHQGLENSGQNEKAEGARTSFAGVVAQIMLLDLVFSLDSVITAVGMANSLWVMAAAIIIAVAIMLAASKPLADFVERHPTVKMLALSFLLLIGMTLIADGAGFEVPKGYIYAAIGFSVAVETLNQLAARRRR
jgi:predicted tellurium resistance membrane protein TerC